MFDPEFLELMGDAITVQPLIEDPTSVHSEQTFGDPVAFQTHLAGPRRSRDRLDIGDVKVDTGRAYLPGVFPEVVVGSKVNLPDGTTAQVNSIEVYHDEDGPHHQVLNYG